VCFVHVAVCVLRVKSYDWGVGKYW
jgi:hypothetical protein